MTVVYLDSVFLFNALLDYLLFLSTARLAGIPLRRRRYLLCGVLGGLYAAAVFLPGGGFLTETLVKAGVGLLLALIAFGRETHFLRLTLLTVAIACALAGTVLALGLLAGQHIPNARGIFYTNVNGKTLLLSASGVYLLLTVIFRAAAAHGIRGECLPVTVCLLGQTVALTALLDTGNSLRDTAGEPVLTAELSRFPQLAAAIQHRPPSEALPLLRQHFPKLRPQLLPMRTAAGGGLLVSVSSDWTEIGGVRYPNLRIALTDTELGGGYTALWGGEGRRDHERMAAAAAVPSGIVPGAGAALYRRQRYAAAAAEPGAGDGAAEPIGEEAARQELIEHNLRLVVYIARRFENTGINIEDLISIGTIGLIKAVGTYRTDKNIKLATYASRCIENEILMFLRKNAGRRVEVSFDEPLNTDYDGNELLLSDVLGTEADVVMRPLEDDVDLCLLASALDTLSPREREIITLRFGLGGKEQTQKEVADRLGISQSYISRLEKRIIQRLKKEILRLS